MPDACRRMEGLGITYAALALSLWGLAWVRGLTYVTAQTVFDVYRVMMPVLDMGIAGLKSPMCAKMAGDLSDSALELWADAGGAVPASEGGPHRRESRSNLTGPLDQEELFAIEPAVVQEALLPDRRLVESLGLTAQKGHPLCASARLPGIISAAERA